MLKHNIHGQACKHACMHDKPIWCIYNAYIVHAVLSRVYVAFRNVWVYTHLGVVCAHAAQWFCTCTYIGSIIILHVLYNLNGRVYTYILC